MASVGGILTVLTSLLSYQIALGASTITTDQVGGLRLAVYATLGLMTIGLFLLFLGLTLQLRRLLPVTNTGRLSWLTSGLSSILSRETSTRIFGVSTIVYAVVFGVISSTIVIRPGANFSTTYGVSVPSVDAVVCCGPIGQVPQLVIYLTQQFAIMVIPTNIIILFTVSWLVGLNSAIARYALVHRPANSKAKWVAGVGAFVGLFTACPTCAGFGLLTTIGLTGAVSLALTFSAFQVAFLAIGLPILVVSPVMVLRALHNARVCEAGHKS